MESQIKSVCNTENCSDQVSDNELNKPGEECNEDENEIYQSTDGIDSRKSESGKEELEEDDSLNYVDDSDQIRFHPSYEQVLLDVNRCAGRLEHIRQCYFHRTDDDNEPPEDLTEELEQEAHSSDVDFDNGSKDLICTNHDRLDDSNRVQRLREDLKCQRELKRKLAILIVQLLIEKPDLHYYQGFHDVCLTYMTLYGHELALIKLKDVVESHFKQFMQPTMLETQEFLAMIPIIVGQHDPRVQEFLELAEVGTIFALSWTITWFSHVIPDERDVETIFSHLESIPDPHVILYLCASIIVHKSQKLLTLEPEMSTIHHFLCQVPRKEKLPIVDLLKQSKESFKKWPPDYIKQKLDDHRRAKLQVQNFNLVQTLTQRVIPTIAGLISLPTPRTAIVVFVLASALAFNFDKWVR